MSRFLKSYRVRLHTLGPVFVGSGREITKKEYVRLPEDKVGIIDIEKFYAWAAHKGSKKQLEDFLLGNVKGDLSFWLRDQNIRTEDIAPFIKYRLEGGDAVAEKGAGRIQVMECIKDAYGMPYVPGSSLKGTLRTILLAADIMNNSADYASAKSGLEAALERGGSRNTLLSSETKQIEAKAFCLLEREATRPQDAVNDILQGLLVSDSEPLSVDDLVLCQKVDVHTDQTERNLPLLRECIKPNADIVFDITIDTSVCKITMREIEEAIAQFYQKYEEDFVSAFQGVSLPRESCVFLGGGCGYVSKTITYPLYGKAKGIGITQQIFDKTNVPREHKHYRDKEYGISPHILKCTKYHGVLVQMGLCAYHGAEER